MLDVHFANPGALQAKVKALRELQPASGEELSSPFHSGDGSRSVLRPSLLGRAFKGEL
jgi:hypothetical protein